MWVDVCSVKPSEPVKEVLELAGHYIIIPFSNSQAHRIASKHNCGVYYVEDIEALKKFINVLRKHVKRKYDLVEINDIQWYPHIIEYSEVLEDNEFYIEYYVTEESDGYYGRHKKSGIEINITDIPF